MVNKETSTVANEIVLERRSVHEMTRSFLVPVIIVMFVQVWLLLGLLHRAHQVSSSLELTILMVRLVVVLFGGHMLVGAILWSFVRGSTVRFWESHIVMPRVLRKPLELNWDDIQSVHFQNYDVFKRLKLKGIKKTITVETEVIKDKHELLMLLRSKLPPEVKLPEALLRRYE